MHAGGFLDRSVITASPSRLAIVIGLHGAAIAALMLAKPEYIPNIPLGSIELIPIEEQVPPPPEPPKAQPLPTKIEMPVPIIEPTRVDPTTVLTVTPPIDQNGGELPVPPPPITVPVISDATMIKGVEVQPEYPIALARQEIEGTATVRVLIGTNGRVKDIQLVSATEPEFFEATARQARRYWRFKPATRDGVPVESWRQMTVRFKLEA